MMEQHLEDTLQKQGFAETIVEEVRQVVVPLRDVFHEVHMTSRSGKAASDWHVRFCAVGA